MDFPIGGGVVKGKRPAVELLPENPSKSKRAIPKAAAKPKKKKSSEGTPLQRFKAQTIAKRAALKLERKRIDRDLKAIEKDLGVLKRPKK